MQEKPSPTRARVFDCWLASTGSPPEWGFPLTRETVAHAGTVVGIDHCEFTMTNGSEIAMKIRTLCLATVLVPGTALAGWSAECAAQAGSEEQVSLSAAVEEVRRSPFHAVPVVAPGAARMVQSGSNDPASMPDQLRPAGAHLDPGVTALTFVTAGVSHVAAAYLFWSCALDTSASASSTGCVLAPFVPLLAVAAPPALSGAGVGKSLGASASGLVGSALAYVATLMVTEQIDNANPLVASVVSGAVHGFVVSQILR